ncbi:MAG TPA: IS110 family transposase [Blastococcus sp.]|jgi:transposase
MNDTTSTAQLVVGVDTHQLTHHVAVIDTARNRIADREFPATTAGYRELVGYVSSLGRVRAYGVESTGSYGAGLTRHLLSAGVEVYEVNRPEKSTRAKAGKSDPIDAYSAAEQVLAGRASGRPKIKTGIIEALRTVKIPRDSAVKERARAYSQIRDLATTAPAAIHEALIGRTARQRVTIAAAYRPDPARLEDPTQAIKHALRALARRVQALDAEIAEADKIITALTKQAVPTLLAMTQVGPQTAAQLVITAGQNIERMRSEAAFAKLTGVAPLPASSGKTSRHRLNPGGDRQANSALYMVVVGRMRNHPETLAYVHRRRAQGLSNPEIIRCLKRHLARSVYRALRTDLMTP